MEANINLKALLFELVFDPKKEGVTAISLVSKPAILTGFVKFNEDEPTVKIVLADEEQRIVLGPVLIPNVKIFRSGKSLGLDQDAYVYFKEETIRVLAEDYLGKLRNHNVTIEHNEKSYDVKMIESWIVEDGAKDKSALYGFELPKGSWVASFKIEDDELWQSIKENELGGFSIEATLGLVAKGEVNMGFSEEEPDDRLVLTAEEKPFILKRLSEVGHSEYLMSQLGFMKVSEDGKLTKEGEALALYFSIDSTPEERSTIDSGLYAVRYKYSGPRDSKNRDFCAEVLDKDLIYRKEDIDQMSFRGENPMSKENYSIFRYKGSYNCRHKWTKQVYFAADWEQALNDLMTYISYLYSVIEYGDSIENASPLVKGAIDDLQKKADEIKKELENFEKSSPFKKDGLKEKYRINVNDAPSDLKEPDYEDEATRVNDKVVRMSRIQLADMDEIDDMIAKIQTEVRESFKSINEFYEKVKEAYDNTKEDVFKSVMDKLDDEQNKIVDNLKEVLSSITK